MNGFFSFKVVCVNGKCRHHRKINSENGGRKCNKRAVQNTSRKIESTCKQLLQVVDKIIARNKGDSGRNLGMSARRIDKQQVEPDKTHHAEEHQHDIGDHANRTHSHGLLDRIVSVKFCFFCHTAPPLTLRLLP